MVDALAPWLEMVNLLRRDLVKTTGAALRIMEQGEALDPETLFLLDDMSRAIDEAFAEKAKVEGEAKKIRSAGQRGGRRS